MGKNKNRSRPDHSQAPQHSTLPGNPQVTTDAFAVLVGSEVDTEGQRHVSYLVTNSGANSIDARLSGRNLVPDLQSPGTLSFSPFIPLLDADAAAEIVVAAGTTEILRVDCEVDEYRVEVKATAGGSQGAVVAWGSSR